MYHLMPEWIYHVLEDMQFAYEEAFHGTWGWIVLGFLGGLAIGLIIGATA